MFSLSMEMSRLTRDGTAEPVSRDQILRHARGQGNINFPCSADHEQDWQPYLVDPYSAIYYDQTYIRRPYKYIYARTGRFLREKRISDHGHFSSYEGHMERRTGKIRGAFSRMHRAL